MQLGRLSAGCDGLSWIDMYVFFHSPISKGEFELPCVRSPTALLLMTSLPSSGLQNFCGNLLSASVGIFCPFFGVGGPPRRVGGREGGREAGGGREGGRRGRMLRTGRCVLYCA